MVVFMWLLLSVRNVSDGKAVGTRVKLSSPHTIRTSLASGFVHVHSGELNGPGQLVKILRDCERSREQLREFTMTASMQQRLLRAN
jgi:hypothetical protein